MDSYSVIIKNPNEERLKTKAFLKNYYSFNEEETLDFLKNSPGFLIESVTLEKAEETHKKAQEHNFLSLIIDDKNIPQLPNFMSFMERMSSTSSTYYMSSCFVMSSK